MNYINFVKWIETHTPIHANEDDFKDYLAMVGVQILDAASKNTGKTIDELIHFHFTGEGHLSQ